MRMWVPIVMAGLGLGLVPGTSRSAAPPRTGGTIYVASTIAGQGDDDATQGLEHAAERAFGAKGFTILEDSGHAAYVADVTLRRTDVGVAQEKVPAGSATMMGTGVSVPFSTGQSRIAALQRSELDIRIRRRGDRTILWHGGAVTVRAQGTRGGDEETVASALSDAAMRIYPRESAERVGVP